jgi:hypothetical protein
MPDVKALTHWRNARREVVRSEHTREVREELPENARAAMVMMAERIARLEAILADLAARALKDS